MKKPVAGISELTAEVKQMPVILKFDGYVKE